MAWSTRLSLISWLRYFSSLARADSKPTHVLPRNLHLKTKAKIMRITNRMPAMIPMLFNSDNTYWYREDSAAYGDVSDEGAKTLESGDVDVGVHSATSPGFACIRLSRLLCLALARLDFFAMFQLRNLYPQNNHNSGTHFCLLISAGS